LVDSNMIFQQDTFKEFCKYNFYQLSLASPYISEMPISTTGSLMNETTGIQPNSVISYDNSISKRLQMSIEKIQNL
jgi:hypothetical protein